MRMAENKTHAVTEAFAKHGVVPDVIPTAPISPLNINYDSGVRVALGNELTPTQVRNCPTRVTWPAEPDSYYMLIMTDPDAPSRAEPTLREVQHWVVGNIRGIDIHNGKTLTEYRGSGPPQGTGLHRYVFLVYKQPNGEIQFQEKFIDSKTREGRLKTSAKDLAAKYGMNQPLAGNFYQAQYDSWVDEMRKQTEAAAALKQQQGADSPAK